MAGGARANAGAESYPLICLDLAVAWPVAEFSVMPGLVPGIHVLHSHLT